MITIAYSIHRLKLGHSNEYKLFEWTLELKFRKAASSENFNDSIWNVYKLKIILNTLWIRSLKSSYTLHIFVLRDGNIIVNKNNRKCDLRASRFEDHFYSRQTRTSN